MDFVRMSKGDKVISARSDMMDFYHDNGWVSPGSETAVDGLEDPETSQPTKPAPTIAEMRSWALKTGISGVSERGKLPTHAVRAYMQAH